MSELIIVDLGELSRTHFGTSVKTAILRDIRGVAIVSIDTGVISKDLMLEKSDPVGTYVIYDAQGSLVGATREVYSLMQNPSDETIRTRILELLGSKKASVLNLSPRELREKLSAEFGIDMSSKKDLVKETIASFINKQSVSQVPPNKKASKVLELSPELEQFCSKLVDSSIVNLAQVRSCILKYADMHGLKDKTEVIFDEELKKVFPMTSAKRKRIKIFQIYKCLKSDKAYRHWSYS